MTAVTALQIDTREADWIKAWSRNPPEIFKDVIIPDACELSTGDAKVYTAAGAVLNVERKTPGDFLSSIPNDHIFDQAGRMMAERKTTGEIPFLVIAGEILRNAQSGGCIIPGSKHGDGWNWNAVQGALLTIQEIGVPVIFCAGDAEYAPTLERLAARKQSVTVVNPRREVFPLTPQERVLCGFDGIGPELAGEILKRCGSLAWALDYLCDTSPTAPKIAGIGVGRKQVVSKILGLTDEMTLKVCAR